ncbi:MAG: hypothetical protein ACPGOY_17315 [Rhodospirillaceae bacterium]
MTIQDPPATALPEIPVVPVPEGLGVAQASAQALEERTTTLLDRAAAKYPKLLISWLDKRAASWLAQTNNPYRDEIHATQQVMAKVTDKPGVLAFNLAHLWGCTAAVVPARDDGAGMMLVRTLDWPTDGLGRALILATGSGPAGAFTAITWPGYAGVLTGMAPGRFAISLNQAPLPAPRALFPFYWLKSRLGVFGREGLPPEHAIRHALEHLEDFEAAARYLAEVPLCMPVIFSIAGPEAGQGRVIERRSAGPGGPGKTFETVAPEAVANQWIGGGDGTPHGIPTSFDSGARLAGMRGMVFADDEALPADWVRKPVLCANTRLAAEMDPARGQLWAQGYEAGAPVTQRQVV